MAAREDLRRASRLDEADPTPGVWQLPAIRGLQEGIEVGLECFREVQARHRWSVQGHIQTLQLLTEKWGGSHQAMFGFGRAASASGPAGSPGHRVIADAHVESCLLLRYF